MDKSLAFLSSLHTGQNHLACTKDFGNPAFIRELDLDRGIHAGFLRRLDAFRTQILVELFASHGVVILETCLLVHENHLTFLGAFRGRQAFRTMLSNHSQNLGNHIRILRLVQDARNVEHAVLEEFDRNFLFNLKTVTLREQHKGHGIMTEPRVLLGFLRLHSASNLVSGAFASPQDALLFHLQQGVLDWEFVQEYVRVHSERCANQDHHRGQSGSVH